MAQTDFLPTPNQVFNGGRDRVTALAQIIASYEEWSATYEARIGLQYFEQFKAVAAPGQELTEAEIAYNADIDWMGQKTLEMVTLWNSLRDNFLTPGNKITIGQMRTDH